jgi:hypothetical protein
MRLGVTILDNVVNINTFDVPKEVFITSGNQTRLYLMLQSEKKRNDLSSRMRYIPSALATMTVTFLYIDSTKEIVNRTATMAYSADDRSIWYVDIAANEVIAPDSINAVLTDGSVVTQLSLFNTLRSEVISGGLGKYYC